MTSTLVSSDFRTKSNLTLGTGLVDVVLLPHNKKSNPYFFGKATPSPSSIGKPGPTGEPRRNPPSRYTGQWAIRGTIYRAVGAEDFSHCGLGSHILSVSRLLVARGQGKNRRKPARYQTGVISRRLDRQHCQLVQLHIKISI